MTVDPALPTPPPLASGSPERFGYSWDRFTELTPLQEEQFDGWSSALPREAWSGAAFLDVGCGMGRNSVWACRKGAARGVAMDVDERSLAHARHNLAGLPVEVRFTSAYEIPDADAFDVVFSLGVLHHLERPDLAVSRMVRAARPGGWVLVWLYGRENNGWIVHLFNPLRRGLFSRLPLGVVNPLAWVLTGILWLSLRLGWGRLPYHDILRRAAPTHLKHIVLDHMIPRIADYYTREEAVNLLARAGLEEVRAVWVNRISWSVVGRKPLGAVTMGEPGRGDTDGVPPGE